VLERGKDVPFPVDDIFAAEVENALKGIPEYDGRRNAGNRLQDLMLAEVAVLIFIDKDEGIGRADHEGAGA
jgi:hypothetical protein